MALTLQKLEDQVEIVWGGEHDARLVMADVINEAGRYLVGMHSWSWRARPPVELTAVTSQPFLTLPLDFGENGEVIDLVASDTALSRAIPTDLAQITLWRNSSSFSPVYLYHWAMSYPGQTVSTSQAGNPQIELYPTPTSESNITFNLTYRAGWKTLVNATDAANVPPHINHLLSRLIQAFSAAQFNPGIAPFNLQTIDEIVGSDWLMGLKRSDGAIQSSLGTIRGGILERLHSLGFGIVVDTTTTWA